MTKMKLVFALAVALLPVASSAGIYIRFKPILQVNPVSQTTFEVIEDYGEGARGIWCAAAHFAQFRLGKTRGRIWLADGRGPSRTMPGRTGVLFSTEPVDTGYSSPSLTVRDAGANLLVNHAIQFCKDYDYEFDDF